MVTPTSFALITCIVARRKWDEITKALDTAYEKAGFLHYMKGKLDVLSYDVTFITQKVGALSNFAKAVRGVVKPSIT